MRIEWDAESGRKISLALEKVQYQLEECEKSSVCVEEAMHEANPDGSDKRMRSIENQYETIMRRLREAINNASELNFAVRRMIDVFEETEEEAIYIVERLKTRATVIEEWNLKNSTVAGSFIEREMPNVFEMPEAIIAPEPRIGVVGLIPGWLEDLLNEFYL